MNEEHEQSQIARDYGPKWSYAHTAYPLSNPPVGNHDGLQQGYIACEEIGYRPEDAPEPPKTHFLQPAIEVSMDHIRKLIEDEIRQALYPGGTISAHEHRRVEMSDQDGKHWRGVLYRVDEEKPAQVPSGVCWACGEHGKAEEMMWLDQFGKRSHLIHATVECIRAAESKPESR